MNKADLRIVFMGTPEFAVTILKTLVEQKYNVVGVVTVPDKPAGRGLKIHESDVKKYAVSVGLPVLQPVKMKDPDFLHALSALNANLQIVVAFRMLPEVVWAMPSLGTFNLHASLLPQYRGAAPINHAIINGENKSGVTTFLIDKEIDTGKIMFSEAVDIPFDYSAGDLHNDLMKVGATLVVKTVDAIVAGDVSPRNQTEMSENMVLKTAPKIFREHCKVDWTKGSTEIHNQIRGLSPYPAAWSLFRQNLESQPIEFKIFKAEPLAEPHQLEVGSVITDGKRFIKVAVNDGFINLKELQLAGKKRLSAEELLRGFKFSATALVLVH